MAGWMRPVWEPRVPFRFDPLEAAPRRLVAVSVVLVRYQVDGVRVPRELGVAWLQALRAAAFYDRARGRAYSTGQAGVGEWERFRVAADGALRLAYALVTLERFGSVTDRLAQDA